jgi:plastocyanin
MQTNRSILLILHSRSIRALILTSLLAVLGAAACNSPTAPYGGGGGGGGNGGAGTGGAGSLFNLGPFAVNQSATFTFPSAGAFGYHCIPHQAMGMTGTVQVDAGGSDSTVVQIGAGGGLSFTPATAHIKPGAQVRWVNASGSTVHTVTSD